LLQQIVYADRISLGRDLRLSALGPLRVSRPRRAILLREARNSVGSAVKGVERHSTMSARDNPTAKSDRSSTSSRGLIAERISNDASNAMP
jgi:hypothetical protein